MMNPFFFFNDELFKFWWTYVYIYLYLYIYLYYFLTIWGVKKSWSVMLHHVPHNWLLFRVCALNEFCQINTPHDSHTHTHTHTHTLHKRERESKLIDHQASTSSSSVCTFIHKSQSHPPSLDLLSPRPPSCQLPSRRTSPFWFRNNFFHLSTTQLKPKGSSLVPSRPPRIPSLLRIPLLTLPLPCSTLFFFSLRELLP
jgi:hypothetical protein